MGKPAVGFSTNSDISVRLMYKGDNNIKHVSKNYYICIGTRKQKDEYITYNTEEIQSVKCKTIYNIKIKYNNKYYRISCGAYQKFKISTDKMSENEKLSGWICTAANMSGLDFDNYKYYIHSDIPGVKYELVEVDRRLLPRFEKLYNTDVVADNLPTYNVLVECENEKISILTINNRFDN